MTIEIIKNGKVVASSKNLEVIRRYARTHSPIKSMKKEGHILIVHYDDGARLQTTFGSENILTNYIRRRGY